MAAQAALGTPLFMAPELFKCSFVGDGSQKFVQPSVDIWSLGATLFMMVCGRPPWVGRNELELSHRIQHTELTFPNHGTLSSHLRNLLRKMLVKEPLDRIEMHEIFEDAWVTQEGCDPIELDMADFGAVSAGAGLSDAGGDSGPYGYGSEESDDDGDGIVDNDDSEDDDEDGASFALPSGGGGGAAAAAAAVPAAVQAQALVAEAELAELRALLSRQAGLTPADTLRVQELMARQAAAAQAAAAAKANAAAAMASALAAPAGDAPSRSRRGRSSSRGRPTDKAGGRGGGGESGPRGKSPGRPSEAGEKVSLRDLSRGKGVSRGVSFQGGPNGGEGLMPATQGGGPWATDVAVLASGRRGASGPLGSLDLSQVRRKTPGSCCFSVLFLSVFFRLALNYTCPLKRSKTRFAWFGLLQCAGTPGGRNCVI